MLHQLWVKDQLQSHLFTRYFGNKKKKEQILESVIIIYARNC